MVRTPSIRIQDHGLPVSGETLESKAIIHKEAMRSDSTSFETARRILNSQLHFGSPPPVVGTSKKALTEMGKSDESQQKREEVVKSEGFIGRIIAWLTSIGQGIRLMFSKLAGSGEERRRAAASVLIGSIRSSEISTEGIFRLSGSKATVDAIVDALPQTDGDLQGISAKKQITSFGVHELTGALKEIYGKMNLLGHTQELKQASIYLGSEITTMTEKDAVGRLKDLIGYLSEERQNDLKILLDLLGEVAELHQQNKMTTSNLAIVIGPRLIVIEDPYEMMATTQSVNALTEGLIKYHKQLFAS